MRWRSPARIRGFAWSTSRADGRSRPAGRRPTGRFPGSSNRPGRCVGGPGRRPAASRGVCLSEHDLAATEDILPDVAGKGVVIPPGVDDSFRRPPPKEEGRRAFGIPPGAFLFLLAARADPGKNIPAAVEAFLALRGKGDRKSLLLVAGQDPPAGGGPGGGLFTGPVSHAKMPALFSAADAVLGPSEYESFGLVPLEALASGVPVIVPRAGYWGETVLREGGGATYPPGRPAGPFGGVAGGGDGRG